MSDFTFEGFIPPTKNYFHMPNVWIDICAEIKNLAELKVVQYVLRHTWGYREYGIPKAISVDEFMHGRKREDGSRMDKGTGLSNHSVIDGLKAAIKHGFLVCEVDTSDLARVKKSYALKMASTPGEVSSPHEEVAPGEKSTGSSEESSSSYEESSHLSEDSSHRSEKDTSRNTPKKDTEEKQDTYTAPSSSQPSNADASTRTHSEQDEDYRPDFTASQSASIVREVDVQALNHAQSASQANVPIVDVPRTAEISASAGQAELSTNAVEKPVAHVEKPKRPRAKKAAEPEIAFTEQGRKVYDAWCSLFKSPPRTAEKTVDCANDLYARLMPWCRDLRMSCRDLLNEIKGWLYTTDPDWYRRKGVTLCDIGAKFESWQSVKTDELEQAKKKPAAASQLPPGVKRWTPPKNMQVYVPER